ncbi:MAG: 1,4-dihydroxy-2-naphthoate polyprenyltransferase [Deltaproteobacteria bacterium]|nr:1,4-dihydroxy-2-naphthoate polyprenyltransferase [Deltaproteobacteria bacterium]
MNAKVEPGSLSAYLLAARPRTLTAALSPVLVGGAIASSHDTFAFLPFLAALLGAVWIQVGTNIANDLHDYLRGTDSHARLGPPRAAQSGLLTTDQLLAAMIVSFSMATLCGVYLVAKAGWPIAVAGVFAIASGIAYTAGPMPLGYVGVGDLFVFIFFGPVAVCGTYYVQAGFLTSEAILASISVGLLTTAILVVNDVRDIESDMRAGKRTLPIRFGRKFGLAEYASLIAVSYCWLFLMAYVAGNGWLLLPWLGFPWALSLIRYFFRTEPGPRLNLLLARTAQHLLLYSVLLGFGFLVRT